MLYFELSSVGGQEGGRESLDRYVAVHQVVGSAFGGKFDSGNSEYVREAAELIPEEENVSIS